MHLVTLDRRSRHIEAMLVTLINPKVARPNPPGQELGDAPDRGSA